MSAQPPMVLGVCRVPSPRELSVAPRVRGEGTPPTSRQPRLGFAGIGWIGRNRLEAIAGNVPVEIVAIADPAADAAAKLAATLPGVIATAHFEEMLSMDLDGVVIATPSALHAEQSIAALDRGLAVFCQKPLARTAAETQAVVAAARRADRLLGVDLSYRHTAGMRAIRELVRRGELGRIYAIEAVFHNAYGPDKAWFYDVKSSGGGCLLDLGIHLVDLALWCLDFPKVTAVHSALRHHQRLENCRAGSPDPATGPKAAKAGLSAAGPAKAGDPALHQPDSGVEDYAAGLIELATGATLQLACSWRVPAGCDARIEVTFFGTRGGASFRNVDGSFYDFVAEHFLPDRSRRVLARPPDAWGGRAAIAWAEQLARSPGFDPDVEHVTAVAATLDQMYGR